MAAVGAVRSDQVGGAHGWRQLELCAVIRLAVCVQVEFCAVSRLAVCMQRELRAVINLAVCMGGDSWSCVQRSYAL